MEKTSVNSIYMPLDGTWSQIRLVHIQPRSLGDEIASHLHLASLADEDCIFEALSYEWGDPEGTQKPIKLNGHTITVRENLWNALWHLRDGIMTRVMWIDALAINQEDETEKVDQVREMGEIYKRCSQVIAWIGMPKVIETSVCEKRTDFECGVELIDLLLSETLLSKNQSKRTIEDEGFYPNRKSEMPSDKLEGTELTWRLKDERWTHIKILYENSYWQRLWIIQEIALAPEVIVQCGNLKIGWDRIVDFRTRHLQLPNGDQLLVDTKLGQDAIVLHSLIKTRDAFHSSYSFVSQEMKLNLIELVFQHRRANCSNLRDHVFGLLGLCLPCCRASLVANYLDSATSICEQMILHWMMTHYDEGYNNSFIKDVVNLLVPQDLDLSRNMDQDVVLHYIHDAEALIPLKMFRCGELFCKEKESRSHSHIIRSRTKRYPSAACSNQEAFQRAYENDQAYALLGVPGS